MTEATGAVRHWYGFGLSLLTAIMWGVLPVFLALSLTATDAISITWYRFFVAALVVAGVLAWQRALPRFESLRSQQWLLLVIAGLGLCANYVFYLLGLALLNAETAQVLIQLAPFLLMLGGILLFKERFTALEKTGALVLFVGLTLFFNDRLVGLFASLDGYTQGVLWVLAAAVVWAAYALAQKSLFSRYSARQLTLLIYTMGALVLLPFSDLDAVLQMNQLQFLALLFCCANTLIAYGAFTEALHAWHASKVSAVIASAPVFTFIAAKLAVQVWPQHFQPTQLNLLAYAGAALVVIGSMLTALGRQKVTDD